MHATDMAIEKYNLDYKLLESSGPAMTAVLKRAVDEHQWIVVTGWTPHWMFTRFKLKFLEDPKGIFGKAETITAIARKGFGEQHPFVANQSFRYREYHGYKGCRRRLPLRFPCGQRCYLDHDQTRIERTYPGHVER